ncbi:MAG: hypothetical protein CTY19_09235 [Methylomonas sp.]|nr:MAG: hypothetical protein CTY19_09235 [Methylomonas sp.]
MAELLFIATTVFVAYVLFSVIGDDKKKPDASQPDAQPADLKEPTPTAEITPPPLSPTPKPVSKPAKKTTAAKPKAAAPAKKAQSTPPPAAVSSDSLKNPKTGEVAKLPSNYAFAKRWIKEALVEEGLLDKIYKNNELDGDTNAKILNALQQLKTLEKYQ